MDQRSICLFLEMKGLSARAIHNELTEVLGPEAIAYSTVTKYLRLGKMTTEIEEIPFIEFEHEENLIDQAITLALNDEPFASIRQIARKTLLPRSTIYRHLTNSMGFVVKHLRWVPHNLSDDQKQMRISKSIDLLHLLNSMKHHSWRNIVTLDESWFYLATDYDSIWLPPAEAPPTREKKMISSPKLMLTIVWNPHGFHIIDILPKGAKFNSDYYISHILTPLAEIKESIGVESQRKLIVHADNARPHTAKKVEEVLESTGLRNASHPPYSPDLAPSDFFLFGYLKEKMKGESFTSNDELLERVIQILNDIPPETLTKVFDEWIDRLQACINANGDYFE
jgi:transposase